MFFFKSKRSEKSVIYNTETLPEHIAIIMDGNGRWAKKRGLPRQSGHAAGSENFRRIATYCRDIGIKYLTVYAFSTENWRRPTTEITAIMELFKKYLAESIEKMEKDRMKLKIFGDLSPFPNDIIKLAVKADEISKRLSGFQANICINYGGRNEILRAAKALAQECVSGALSPGDIDERRFSEQLFSSGIPDPDLVIRPSGEQRISNFLLWQSAYAEYYFTDVLWPDFGTGELDMAIAAFQGRERRYGGLNANKAK